MDADAAAAEAVSVEEAFCAMLTGKRAMAREKMVSCIVKEFTKPLLLEGQILLRKRFLDGKDRGDCDA